MAGSNGRPSSGECFCVRVHGPLSAEVLGRDENVPLTLLLVLERRPRIGPVA